MSVGTAFHPRTAPLNRKMQWREWAGYFASSVYADFHDIEYNAIREAAAVIDVSPLYKYRVSGPGRAAPGRPGRSPATRRRLKVGQVFYTPWCDEHGKVIDDGTVHRVSDDEIRWTAADPQYRWLTQNAAGLDVEIEDVSEALAALALQGPLQPRRPRGRDRRELRRPALLPPPRELQSVVSPIDVSRTGYTGDLGYELWIPADAAPDVWDALFEAGQAYAIRPAGMHALDVVRLEAGLVMLEVDYTSARHAMNPEQNYSPFEIGLGKLVSFDKGDYVGRRALQAEVAGGWPGRRLVGLQLDWYDIEGLYDAQGLPPAISPVRGPHPGPGLRRTGARWARRPRHGWSPILKQALALAFVPPRHERSGSQAAGGVDRRGPPRPRQRDGRGAAVPRPRRASAHDRRAAPHPGAVPAPEAATDFTAFDRLVDERIGRVGRRAGRVPAHPVRGR